MRILSFKDCKWDKKYIIAALITLLAAIICGIVLYIFANINSYFQNFATDYIYYIFNFKNSSLIFPHLLSELIYLYLFFLIAYFTKLKYLTLIILFLRTLYFTLYAAILIALNSIGGVTVAVFIFIPTAVISLALCILCAETCKSISGKYAFCAPAVFAVADTLIMVLLLNVIFRVVIIIV